MRLASELACAGTSGCRIKLAYEHALRDLPNLKTKRARLARDCKAVNLAIATPAALPLQMPDCCTPLLFTAILAPKSAGLEPNLECPACNATGVLDLVAVADQINLLHQTFPLPKTIGLKPNASEPNSVYQIKHACARLKQLGLRYQIRTAATTKAVQQAADALACDVDALYHSADNELAAAMPTIGMLAMPHQIPVVPAASTMVMHGGTITCGIDTRALGKQTACMAIKLLCGTAVKKLAVAKPAMLATVKKATMQQNICQTVHLPK